MAPKTQELQAEIDELRAEIKLIKDTQNKNIEELQQEVQRLRAANATLHKKCEDLNEKAISLELYSRRENLIFDGIKMHDNEDCWIKIKKILTNKLNLDHEYVEQLKIQRCHKLSENKKKKTQRIIVRFLLFEDREKVWAERSSLSGSEIYINEDFPIEIVNRRKTLYPIMKKARSLNKLANINRDRLIIDGKSYTVKTLKQLPPELDPAKLATKTDGTVTAFFSGSSPLSNFYQTDIMIDNHVYHSVEQYFQFCKAEFAEDISGMSQIKEASHPAMCKSIGNKIQVDWSKWLPEAKKALKKGCHAKFTQDQRSKDFLLETEDNTLVEATLSKTWGIGLSLGDKELFNRQKWSGQNVMGSILTEIRAELK